MHDTPEPVDGSAYGEMIAQLRLFLDAVTYTRPDAATLADLQRQLAEMTSRLGARHPEDDRTIAARQRLPSRGRAMIPPCVMTKRSPGTGEGSVVFGAHFLGRNGAAHGGAIAALFDEALGVMVNSPQDPRARTAFLHVDFHRIAPIDRPLQVRAEVFESVGRKRRVRGSLSDGEDVCATAEALFIVLRDGQP